jgi:type II secretory pathway pseudopilin PulG
VGRLKARAAAARRCGAREKGYLLLDALVALIIIAVGFAAFLSGLGLAGRIAAKQNARVASLIEERSTHAKERTVFFQRK